MKRRISFDFGGRIRYCVSLLDAMVFLLFRFHAFHRFTQFLNDRGHVLFIDRDMVKKLQSLAIHLSLLDIVDILAHVLTVHIAKHR